MFPAGTKVRVRQNIFKYLPGYVGKRGKVVAGISNTGLSCRVKLVGDKVYWFDNRELELDK